MFELSFSKILLTVLVILAAWRGWRLYQQVQGRMAAAARQQAPSHPGPQPRATDLVECPRCGSANTREVSRFGSTPCKALWQCNSCAEPFDRFKCH